MGMMLERFDEQLSERSLSPADAEQEEGALRVLHYMECCEKLEEIDFDSFTLSQAELAVDHLCMMDCAESSEEAEANRDNLLTEWNRLAHLRNTFDELKPPKKSFF
ncbi:hypothetical protein [Paenibacillus abyssi]|uniref:Uncharacterized protein n=1 Tax=Paenibacillus abyssi TaxID=1340531 RepID=A0A917G1N1_9BACL|nr:hypothetical protein [Paenibacillus abyssi]GGG18344.1 hypothetical protein GCM10010916_38970 [Paenibacillus abyssi]